MSHTQSMAAKRPHYVDGAAVISGLGIYIPIPGLRGAMFCLFPGIAQRSLSLTILGAACGFVADFLVCFGWFSLGLVWEPRVSYSPVLDRFLPPEHDVCTHCGCPVPNFVQFALGLAVWMSVMFAVWMWLWRPPIKWTRQPAILTSGAVSVLIAATILWIVTPLDGWWSHGARTFGDLPPAPLFFVLVVTMPLCCLIVALLIRHAASTRPAEESQDRKKN